MKILSPYRRNFPRQAISVIVLFLAFLLIIYQGATIHTPVSAKTEKSSNSREDGKKSDESVVLINATSNLSGFQVHFDHFCRIIISIPDHINSYSQVFCHFTGFFNSYFNTLFHFIIATKAP